MPQFGKRIDGPGGRRKARREQVTLAAAALALEGSHSVMIEDVGPTGAKLRSRRFGRTGQELLIRAGPLEILASVIWTRHDECGILFDEPLNEDALEFLKREANWAAVMRSS